jgi:hypothetical protein
VAYLIQNDYKKLIQSDNLQQVIGSDTNVLIGVEMAAQAEAISYLVQKYEVNSEFTNTGSYDPAYIYKANSRVYLDAPAYSASATYVLGQLTLYGNNVYVANVAILVPEAFNLAHWILIGPRYSIFYVPMPEPEFKLTGQYKPGDKVFWKDKVYTCLIGTIYYDQSNLLQYGMYSNVPYSNIFPDDIQNGLQYWGVGVAFTVPAGTLYNTPNNYAPQYVQTFQNQYTAVVDNETEITIPALIDQNIIQIEKEIKPLLFAEYSFDKVLGKISLLNGGLTAGQSLFTLYSNILQINAANYWLFGDNRNQQLVNYLIDIALYHVHSRIAPRNIPDLRIKRYDDAIKWLKMAGRGDITADLPLIQPKSGARIRYGGQIKNINSY